MMNIHPISLEKGKTREHWFKPFCAKNTEKTVCLILVALVIFVNVLETSPVMRKRTFFVSVLWQLSTWLDVLSCLVSLGALSQVFSRHGLIK